ncbi:hypothetical protein EPR50_G00103800 [Perca flavescens]|uniref:Alpha-2-macroglobulin bait region domain-containing protein n=1 Tax=Perca flavescens TaxID=8167 RepID=A0A484D135_PERFV|nr:hypothetical protein EPR50_G00103800 [Perca flavescens]
MSRTLLWLLASLAFVSLTSLADGAALKLMSAPNLLRVGTAENIFVECQDCTGGNIPVQIHVMNHPAKTRRLTSTSVTLTSERNFQELGQITIPVGNFSKAPTMKQYVYLQAQFPDKVLEKVVLVSFQSGYIFIQTDKTLYTPNSKVHYRMFAVTPRMEPVERDAEAQTDAAIAIEIVTPEGIILPCDTVFLRSGIHSGGFPLAETISTGLWKVVAKFKSNPQQSYSAEFEVKEYVLPSFEVKLIPESSFFYVDSRELTVNIKASYLFGQEVDGMAYVVFGVMQENSKKSFPSSLQRVQVEVVNPDGTPAERVPVVVDPGQVQALTTANGMAKLSINTEAREQRLTITARTNDPHISHERQVSATMVALPYTTRSNNYIHISVDTAELELGDTLKVNLILKRQENHDKDITYLILNRGQLVKNGRFNTRSHVVNTLKVTVTKEMLPSFRIIAYYHTNGNEVVSDSVWVDVKDSCMGSLRLESSNPYRSYGPRKRFGLKITGDPGATVGLVAVDKGVYVLNNKHRLTQKKVWDIVEKYDTGCTPGGGKDGMGVFYDAGLLFESNTASGTPDRQELKCPAPSRRKRAATIMDITTSLGICVGEPLEVIIRKEFFIDLRLPYSAVRQEQLEIKAILHNNSPDPLTVLVDLTEEEHVCSSAFKRGKYRQEVKMGAQTTQAVPFIIIPMKEGKYNIEVKAAVKDSLLNDGIIKKLLVVPEGVLVKSPQIILLDPTTKGVGEFTH